MKNLFARLNIRSLFENIFNPSKPKWIYVGICLLASGGIYSTYLQGKTNNKERIVVKKSEESTDTFIPNGYVLVPLEISNAVTISSLMGRYTYVDVYTISGLEDRPKKVIAQNLRMVKAPHDDNQFAVLVKEAEHELIHSLSEPVFVVIKNPNKIKNETIVKQTEKVPENRKSRVSYGY